MNSETKQKFLLWLNLPDAMKKPPSVSEWARKNKITPRTAFSWKAEHGGMIEDDDEQDRFIEHVKGLVYSGKANAKVLELYARMIKIPLVDQKEHKARLEIDADQLARTRKEASRRVSELRGSSNGVGSVCEQPVLLPEKICAD